MSADNIVNALLEDGDGDIKSFMRRNFTPPDKSHLHSSIDGGLYDTRKPDWHKGPPLRPNYQRFNRQIDTVADFKGTWRARYQTNYPLSFDTHDGGHLCEQCTEKHLRQIVDAIRSDGWQSGWRVVGVSMCHNSDADIEDCHTACDQCGKNLGELG